MEETGKTGLFELRSPAKAPVLARMTAGDEVLLKPEGNTVRVENGSGETLGLLPARAALRLIELLNGGNRYVAGVVSVAEIGHPRPRPGDRTRPRPCRAGSPSPPREAPSRRSCGRTPRTAPCASTWTRTPSATTGTTRAPDGDAETEDSTADIEYYEEGEGNSNE